MRETPVVPFSSHSTFDEYAIDYDHALIQGVSLSGESPDYFASKRIQFTADWIVKLKLPTPKRVADFGCGVGNSTPHLERHFPEANLLGLDVSEASIQRAHEMYGRSARFVLMDEEHAEGQRDLVYCNGVFHHIEPRDRPAWSARIYDILAPGGCFALWENNPWNPGTRMVMNRIPFDRDAITLTAAETRALLVESGFQIVGTRFHFYFPKILSALRGLERYVERIPLGAQYCVLARRPTNPLTGKR